MFIYCGLQVILARQIYDEQLPFISKVLSAAIVGLLDFFVKQITVWTTLMCRFIWRYYEGVCSLYFKLKFVCSLAVDV